jgi:hypothetical protein
MTATPPLMAGQHVSSASSPSPSPPSSWSLSSPAALIQRVILPLSLLLPRKGGSDRGRQAAARAAAPAAEQHQFLLVLYPGDGDGACARCCLPGRLRGAGAARRRFVKLAAHLNGVLHVSELPPASGDAADADAAAAGSNAARCECCHKPYAVRGVVSRHALYARLPKEDIYVPLDDWYHEYLKSQMLELMYVLRRLGARSVQLTLERADDAEASSDASASASASLGLLAAAGPWAFLQGLVGSAADAGIKASTVEHTTTAISLEASYADSNSNSASDGDGDGDGGSDGNKSGFHAYGDYASFLADPRVYYLGQRQDWQDVVQQRLACGATEIKFSFSVANSVRVERAFYAKLQRMGLNVQRSHKESGTLTITGRVTF